MNRWLVIAGLLLVWIGLLWPWLSKLPLGRLPGDIAVQKDGVLVLLPADDLAGHLSAVVHPDLAVQPERLTPPAWPPFSA
jgi:Protein of unknown function (DUF2905).